MLVEASNAATFRTSLSILVLILVCHLAVRDETYFVFHNLFQKTLGISKAQKYLTVHLYFPNHLKAFLPLNLL